MSFSKAVVKLRIPIVIVTLLLAVLSVFGMVNTRINYDMLDYLPEDMDTVIGQNELLDDFGKGAFSFIVVEDMPSTWKRFFGTVLLWMFPFLWSFCRKSFITNSTPATQLLLQYFLIHPLLRMTPWMLSAKFAPSQESSVSFRECPHW